MSAPAAPTIPRDGTLEKDFRPSPRGRLLQPGDAGYDEARRVWNGRVDRRPALVARCAGAADVVAALAFAQRRGLAVSVRSSGHNVTGCAVCDGGLTIDLSLMKSLRVDPARRTVRAGAGVTWGELDHETQAFGLATTGGRISTTGVAGLTLGGGYGWLMRSCGLAVDNLLSVDLVTADGRLLTAGEASHADLFWGLRGGGGNFGVATSFEYRLHPVGPAVTGGMAFYPVERARELLLRYRDAMASAPDALSVLFNVLGGLPPAPIVPDHLHGSRAVAMAVCHVGPPDEARRDLAPFLEGSRPLVDFVRPMRYTTLQRLFDEAGVFGRQVHAKSGHLAALDDDVVDTLVAHAAGITSPLSIVMISPLGGAVARVGEHETAFSHRRTAYDYAINSVWTDPADAARHVRWTDDFWRAMQPHSTGAYVNELDGDGEARVREAYGPATYARLVALKDRYDPDNVFRFNQNVKPTTQRGAR